MAKRLANFSRGGTMQMIFSEDEMKYIDTSTFGWKAKKGCPKKIKDKLDTLMEYGEDILNGKKQYDIPRNKR